MLLWTVPSDCEVAQASPFSGFLLCFLVTEMTKVIDTKGDPKEFILAVAWKGKSAML